MSAWPALQSVYYDGWMMRFAGGYTRRSNSVSSIYPSTLDPLEKIAHCEHVYRRMNLPTVFKITPANNPSELDRLLEQCGYKREGISLVQTASLEGLPPATHKAVTLLTEPSAEWLDAYCRLSGVVSVHRPTMERLLASIVPKHCFVAVREDDQIVAVGLTAVDRGYAGLYDIVTSAEWRGRGFGQQLLLHLLNWAKANGAQQAFLQVSADNEPALRLYGKLGFKEVYPYWYRSKG